MKTPTRFPSLYDGPVDVAVPETPDVIELLEIGTSLGIVPACRLLTMVGAVYPGRLMEEYVGKVLFPVVLAVRVGVTYDPFLPAAPAVGVELTPVPTRKPEVPV